MERFKKIIILSVGLSLGLVATIAFAVGFTSDETGTNISQTEFIQDLRIQMIKQLISNKFDRFVTMPFGPGNDNMHLTGSIRYPDYPDYYLNTAIDLQDDLDILINQKIQELSISHSIYYKLTNSLFDQITLDTEDMSQLQKVYLFKNEKDLKELGYVISSYRTRINNDAAWRRDNISISYRNIGNVRVFNPQQEFSFMDEIHYDPIAYPWKRDIVSGLAIMGGVTSVKGGGICGASRGINTVLLPNKAFDITQRYNHTRTYKNMYDNYINGQEFRIPGLDVAVYRMAGGTKDFKFQNIRDYPVVLVMNYDGSVGGMEELFVLSKQEDRGKLKYIGKNGNCYNWEANGEPFKSCYSLVAR